MTLPLHIDALELRSPRGRSLLQIDALRVAPGTLLGVRGPSGAGKSSFVFAVAGLLPLHAGAVHWGDTRIDALPDAARTAFRGAHMGMIFQDFLLFDELPALANAGLSALWGPREGRGALRDRAARALAHLGLGADNRSVASFSGGERQRVAVARALATDPAVLLADEPTASLDRPRADALIHDLVTTMRAAGKTLVAVSHDAALLERMDRVLTFEDGRLTQDSGA